MDWLTKYQSFSPLLQQHLLSVVREIKSNTRLYSLCKSYLKRYKITKSPESLAYALYDSISAWDMLHEDWFNLNFCYNAIGTQITFSGIINKGKHVFVAKGHLSGESVVVKWYSSGSRNVTEEGHIYQKLREMGCLTPRIWTEFYFWGDPVLIIEKLEKIGSYDNPYTVGIDVLNQLRYLHMIGIHNDIKPDNIMKGNNIYYLIDYGGISMEKMDDGWHRRIWSPKWTSQEFKGHNQLTGPKYDFIELGFTMRYLQNKHSPKTGFSGRLKRYMNYCSNLSCSHSTSDYDALIAILSSSSSSAKY